MFVGLCPLFTRSARAADGRNGRSLVITFHQVLLRTRAT